MRCKACNATRSCASNAHAVWSSLCAEPPRPCVLGKLLGERILGEALKALYSDIKYQLPIVKRGLGQRCALQFLFSLLVWCFSFSAAEASCCKGGLVWRRCAASLRVEIQQADRAPPTIRPGSVHSSMVPFNAAKASCCKGGFVWRRCAASLRVAIQQADRAPSTIRPGSVHSSMVPFSAAKTLGST